MLFIIHRNLNIAILCFIFECEIEIKNLLKSLFQKLVTVDFNMSSSQQMTLKNNLSGPGNFIYLIKTLIPINRVTYTLYKQPNEEEEVHQQSISWISHYGYFI